MNRLLLVLLFVGFASALTDSNFDFSTRNTAYQGKLLIQPWPCLGMSSDVGSLYTKNSRSRIAKHVLAPRLLRNVPMPACVGDALPVAS
jgi:hypothetical protein